MAWNCDTICPKCGKPFYVQEFPMGVSDGKGKEDIEKI